MNRILNAALIFILTKTGVLRWVGTFASGLLAGWGIITDKDMESVTGVVALLLTGLLSLLIDHKKAEAVKEIQSDIGAKEDGYAGPKTQAKIASKIHGGRPA